MKFFRDQSEAEASAEDLAASLPPAKPQISLSAEQKEILSHPVAPRPEKIIRKLYGDRAAAEKALKAGEASGDTGSRHVAQDANGFWRIADGPAPEGDVKLPDAL